MAAASCLAILTLAACGGSSDSDESDAKPAAEATTSAEPSEATDSPAAPAAGGDHPEWANPPSQTGEKISSFKVGDDISVDVFQVGVAKATKSGQFVDPDTNKPIIAEGADIVFVNYVITNNGDPVDLGSSLVDPDARYDDWKYLQGMDSVVDSALFEQMKVDNDVLAPGGYNDAGIYTFGTGQTISVAQNFLYQKDSPITFEAKAIPVDAEGELLHDQGVEGEGKGTIK